MALEVALVVAVVSCALAGLPKSLLVGLVLAGLLRIVSALDAYRSARPAGNLASWVVLVGFCIALLIIGGEVSHTIKATLLEAFRLPSSSMVPTLLAGDYIIVDKRPHRPQRGDIVVFRSPRDREKQFMKRVVALAGDTIETRDHALWLNGHALDERKMDDACNYEDSAAPGQWEPHACTLADESLDGKRFSVVFDRPPAPHPDVAAITIPAGAVFVVGDNRDNSYDSRQWGPLQVDAIDGRALFVWASFGPHGFRWERFGVKLNN